MNSDKCWGKVQVLESESDAGYARRMLIRAAKQVEPLMEKRNWHVPVLTEFYPKTGQLYGVNINRGAKICVRLRAPRDRTVSFTAPVIIFLIQHRIVVSRI